MEQQFMKANLDNLNWFTDRIASGNYSLTKEGNLYSGKTGKELKKQKTGKYLQWKTYDSNKKSRNVQVHRLLYHMFIKPITDDSWQINHIDNDPHNNSLDNLELVDNKRNQEWRVISDRHNKAKLSREQVQYIYLLNKVGKLDSIRRKELCEQYDIVNAVISNIINHNTYYYYIEELEL